MLTHEQSLSLWLHRAGRSFLRQALLLLAAGHHGHRRLLWQEITTKEKVVFFSQGPLPLPSLPRPSDGLKSPRPVVSEWFIPRQIKFSCARLACNDLSCSVRGWRRGNGTTEQGVERREQSGRNKRLEQNNRHFPRIGCKIETFFFFYKWSVKGGA